MLVVPERQRVQFLRFHDHPDGADHYHVVDHRRQRRLVTPKTIPVSLLRETGASRNHFSST
jgi:hypothetical protein